MEQFKLSVIVPTYNGKNKVLKLLNSLCLQTARDFETIVVIDGSTDGTIEALNRYNSNLQHLKVIVQENKGRAGSRNAGAASANGNILLFIDDDMIPSKFLIENHCEAQLNNDVVVGILEGMNEDATNEMLKFSKYKNDKMNLGIFSSQKDDCIIPYITGNNFSIKKSLFDKLGCFDERLNDAEDFELAVRVVENGNVIFYSKKCLAYHTIFKTLEESARRSKEYKKGRDELLKFHPHLSKYKVNSLKKIKRWKRPFFYLFSFNFWLKLADYKAFKFLPPNIRFKLYDILWVGNYYF
jgi:glycosyltransferase involved in cell wall biosynthesis